MGKWQPIETAPKDGTTILGYFPANGLRNRRTFIQSTYYDGHWLLPGWAFYGDMLARPSHWMPLPDPPTD